MMQKLQNARPIVKLFIAMTLILIAAFTFSYINEVSGALNMDPSSYNCTDDSMMRQLCRHPYTASITWAILATAVYCWPIAIAWFITGIILIMRWPTKRLENKSKRIS